MTTIDESWFDDGVTLPTLREADKWRHLAHQQLNTALAAATPLTFDDSRRFIFFSDIHRGDNSNTDLFAPNKQLFLHALSHYWHQGFFYVEVGDGDELWQTSSFKVIRRAHGAVFDWLHRFDAAKRLAIIVGNHDIAGQREMANFKDGIATHESILLKHQQTGQALFVVHGHQADFAAGPMVRLLNRTVGKQFQCLTATRPPVQARIKTWGERLGLMLRHRLRPYNQEVEARLRTWVAENGMPTICGHTHTVRFPSGGNNPYFNTGNCVSPGYLTGLEVANGRISLIRWLANKGNPIRQTLRSVPLQSFASVGQKSLILRHH